MSEAVHTDPDVEFIKTDLCWLNASILRFARERYRASPDIATSALHASNQVLALIDQLDVETIDRIAAVGVPLFSLDRGRDLLHWQNLLTSPHAASDSTSDLRWLNTALLFFARGAYLHNAWLAATTLNSSSDVLNLISNMSVEATMRAATIGFCHFRLRHGSKLDIWKDVHGAACSEYADERRSRNFRANVLTMVGDDDSD